MFDLYIRHEWWFAAVQLALAMFGMGATLRLDDFVAVFRQPKAFVVGFVIQVVGIPLLAMAFTAALAPPPGLGFGLILVAAMPGGAMSNVVTWFARSNVPLSIALTAMVTLTCMVTTPIVLRLLADDLVRADFVMPIGAIAFDIAACLLVPLGLGMIAGAPLPHHRRELIARWCIRASLAVVLLIAIGSAGAGRLGGDALAGSSLLIILLFAVAVQQAGTLPSWALGLSRADAGSIAIEAAIRNTNLALLLKASLFPAAPGVADPMADGVLITALLYGAMAAPLTIPLVLVHRWLARKR
ncbi:MAG: bile acid:sodium symporter family protein [Deltaproteobacteria bacterium]|nr:bile acid:sodium symporter family protein [Deltaproteobacteria bacterium]